MRSDETLLLSEIVPVSNEVDPLPDALKALLEVDLPTEPEIIGLGGGSTDRINRNSHAVRDPRLRMIIDESTLARGLRSDGIRRGGGDHADRISRRRIDAIRMLISCGLRPS